MSDTKRVGSLSSEETKIYTDNLAKRGELLDVMFKGGVPDDHRSIRLSLEIMKDTDDSLLRMAKLAQDEDGQKSDEEFKKALIASIIERKSKVVKQTYDEKEDLPEEYISDIKLLETELVMDKETLSLTDFETKG